MPADRLRHAGYGFAGSQIGTQEEITCESCTLAALAEAAPPC
jgi:hypothetical protein